MQDPNHFKLERFMNGVRITPFAYIPFAVGPRARAGLNFGQSEAIPCLAILIQKFKVTVRPGCRAMPVCRLTLRAAAGMPVTVAPRARAA